MFSNRRELILCVNIYLHEHLSHLSVQVHVIIYIKNKQKEFIMINEDLLCFQFDMCYQKSITFVHSCVFILLSYLHGSL